ncbi:TPA: hypothetical protein N3H29_004366 [Salmonella enterica subsp. enterica serovar Bonn]|nr:hypothetical protein [Salmonella enterica subsp. enterica serovar Potsdam]EBV2338148.1 hypothetical protein [Salmonella enterica subsp. enterica serovar Potsdam]EGG7630142.1 hypothetical protein [Salmonella enterica subsp. enterica serovar Hvittingfoss]HCM3626050.1 hypothetical protein [Salmonella enterica subsp. enterica serovar Bonn]
MNKVGLLFPILNITMLMVIAVSFFSPRNADYYMLMLVFLLAAVVSSFVSIFTIRRMLPGYVKCYMLIAIISSIGFYLLNRGSGAWSEGLISFNVFMVLFQLAGGVVNSIIFFYYGKDQAEEMKLKGYPNSVIEKVYKNILFREVERRIKGKVHPNALSKVAGGIATGVLTETLSSGRADLFSDNLIPAAMSIADSHLANFESGNYSVTGSHANDFNPATGLAMTSDYFDAGGDTYGSALNHDSLFSSDNHISGGFDNHSIDHGSSFSSGFDDSRY